LRLSSPQVLQDYFAQTEDPGVESMRPMRFPRRFPWLIALVLLSFSGVLFLPLGLWYWLAYPPVRHYYLGASCESAFVGDHSIMAVPVQWLSRRWPRLAFMSRQCAGSE